MSVSLDELIKLYTFTSGRRLLALRKVRKVAVRMRSKLLLAMIDYAIEHDLHTRELDLHWNARKGASATQGVLQEIDNLADNVLSGIRDGAMAATRGARPDDPIHDVVQSFLDELVPGGVQAVTSLPFPDQCSAMELMVSKLEGPLARMAAELGVVKQAKRLAELTAEYRAALESRGVSDAIQFAEVQAARELGQIHLLEIVAVILGTYHKSRDPEHMAARTALIEPILAENEAIRVYLRARRGRNNAGDIDDDGDIDDLPELDDEIGDELNGEIEPGDAPVSEAGEAR